MAEVYIGSTKGIGGFEKQVAIKVIHPRYSEDRHFVQMLIQEAKLTVLLNHVNIVQTFDLGREGDNYFIVMEYINGVDGFRLAKRAKRLGEPLPVDVCAYVMAEVCAGLDYAHRRRDGEGRALNIVHRDVSPQNVLISFDGEVKVTDFGIAKAALSENETEVGVIKGKYHYMSPEQAWGDPVDPRGDVFSAGLVLYELLTGDLVYRSKNIVRLLDEVRRAEIKPPHHRRSDLPWGIVDIVMRACAKRPGDRYQSAAEMSQALREFLYSEYPQFRTSQVVDLTLHLFGDDLDTGEMSMVTSQSMPAMASSEFAPDPDQSVLFGLKDLAKAAGEVPPIKAEPSKPSFNQPAGATVDFLAMRMDERDEPQVEDLVEEFDDDEKTIFDAAPFGEQAGETQETENSEQSQGSGSSRSTRQPSLLERAASSMGQLPEAPRPAFAPAAAPLVQKFESPGQSFAPQPSSPLANTDPPPAPHAQQRAGWQVWLDKVQSQAPWARWAALGALGVLLLSVLVFLVGRVVSGPSSIMMHVVSIPHGAEVWVNGTRVRGVTPLRSLQPIPKTGLIDMEVKLEGYETWHESISVAADTSHVVAALRPSPAILSVQSEPAGAKVWVNNQVVGKTPVSVEGLRVGQTVLVRAAKNGYLSQSESIKITKATGEISLALQSRQ